MALKEMKGTDERKPDDIIKESSIRSAAEKRQTEPVGDGIKTAAGIVRLEHSPLTTAGLYWVLLKPFHSLKEKESEALIGWINISDEIEAELVYKRLGIPEKLEEAGLKRNDKVVEIYRFYPFKDEIEDLSTQAKQLLEKGIGTAALELLLKDLKSNGVAGVYGKTTREKMQRRLEKAGFQEIEKNIYFKKLSSQAGE